MCAACAGRKIARQAVVELLFEENLQHGIAGGAADELSAPDARQQFGERGGRAYVVVGAEAVAAAGAIAGGGGEGQHILGGVGGGEQIVENLPDRHGHVNVGQTQAVHCACYAARSQTVHNHVGGGIVTDDDHQGEQIAHGRREAVVEEDEDATGQILFGGGQLPAVVEGEEALFDLAERFDEDGDFEDAAQRKNAPGVDVDPLTGLQVQGGEAHLGAAVVDDTADVRFERHGYGPGGRWLVPCGQCGYGMKFLR